MFSQVTTISQANILQPKQRPEDARQDAGAFGASLTLAKGTVVGKKTADNKLYAYASGNADGTQNPVGFLMYSIATDASGNIYYGDSAVATEFNPPHETAAFWQSGIFDTADLTGYDANVLVVMKGRTLASGYILIP
jgi:hypothetical protein